MNAFVAALGMALALSGCSHDRAPDAERLRQFVMRASVDPGSELTYCQHIDVGAQLEDVHIAAMDHFFGGRSHHFFVYESAAPADAQPFACDRAHIEKTALLYASQQGEDRLAFPDDVALTVRRGHTLLVEWHVVNAGSEPAASEAVLNIAYVDEPPRIEAGMMVYYHPNIYVPAQGSATAAMHCRVPDDVTLMWTTSHMHARGVGHASQVTHRDGRISRVHETREWEDVGMTWLDPIDVSRGDAIDFRCEFENPHDRPFVEGPTARDHEMCMFFAGYYPRMQTEGADACSGSGSGPVFDGELSCAEAMACLRDAGDEVAEQRCFAGTSEASTAPLLDLAHRCARTECRQACDAFDEACTSCLESRCAAEQQACAQATA